MNDNTHPIHDAIYHGDQLIFFSSAHQKCLSIALGSIAMMIPPSQTNCPLTVEKFNDTGMRVLPEPLLNGELVQIRSVPKSTHYGHVFSTPTLMGNKSNQNVHWSPTDNGSNAYWHLYAKGRGAGEMLASGKDQIYIVLSGSNLGLAVDEQKGKQVYLTQNSNKWTLFNLLRYLFVPIIFNVPVSGCCM